MLKVQITIHEEKDKNEESERDHSKKDSMEWIELVRWLAGTDFST